MKMKSGPKPKFAPYRKMLEKKADEVRRSMSAQKAAQVVSRLDVPSDEGDLSQQHHEEWIFLNRNIHRHEAAARNRRRTAPDRPWHVRHLPGMRRADFHQAAGCRSLGALLRHLPGGDRRPDSPGEIVDEYQEAR